MNQSTKRVKRHGKYDPVLKREVARRYLNGEFSYQVAAEEYQLPGRQTVKDFVKWYRGELARQEEHSFPGPQKEMGQGWNASADLGDASVQIEQLRRALHKAERRADAWKAMIDVASEELGIDIVKKPVPRGPSHD